MEEQREVREVRTTDGIAQDGSAVQRQSIATRRSGDANVTIARLVWFIAGVIIVFLALRFVLLLFAANQGSGFVDFIYGVGGFFAAPFFGIFGYTPVYGQFVFEVSTLVAIAIYALIAWGIARLLTLNRPAEVV